MKTTKKLLLLTITLFISLHLSILNADENTIFIPADSWAPFRMMDKTGNKGIDFDFLNEINKRMDIQVKIKKTPWARSLINIKHGKADAMTGVAKRAERAEYMHYISPPYYTCSTVFYVKKGNAHLIKSYADLKDYLIGQVDNSAYFAPYDKDKEIFKRSVKNEVQLVRMLAIGRLKVIIGTDCQVDYDIKRMGYLDKIEKALYKPNNNVDLYFVISKKSPYAKDLEKFSKTIKDIVEEGKVKEFAKKYYQ